MPTLANHRYEAFAQACAKDALLNDAYESAGFVPHRGHPSRLAYRTEVAERIAKRCASQTLAEDNTPVALLTALPRIIKAGEGAQDPCVVRAACLAIVDATRLRSELEPALANDRAKIIKYFSPLSDAPIGHTDLVPA